MKKILTALNSGSLELSHRVVLPGQIGFSSSSLQAASLWKWMSNAVPAGFGGGLVLSPPVNLGTIFPGDGISLESACLADWSKAARYVQSQGGSVFLRIGGVQFPDGRSAGFADEEIDPDLVGRRFKQVALAALSSGFDGIEIDATSLTMSDLLMHDDTNLRTDRWGGEFENRITLLAEVIDGVLSVWERERVCVRLSLDPAGDNEKRDKTLIGILGLLRDQEVGFVHLECCGQDEHKPAALASRLRMLRAFFPYILIVSGHFDLEGAASLVESRVADAVGSDLSIYP